MIAESGGVRDGSFGALVPTRARCTKREIRDQDVQGVKGLRKIGPLPWLRAWCIRASPTHADLEAVGAAREESSPPVS